MTMAGQAKDTIIDIIRRFEWEVSKEQFEEWTDKTCRFSPIYNWRIYIAPRTNFPTGQNYNRVSILLVLEPGDGSLMAEVEGIGVKTEIGYMPGKPYRKDCENKMISKIEHFNAKGKLMERICLTDAGFVKLFNKNKITLVATVRFYVDRNDFIKKNEREQIFLTQISSISYLDMLADFTIICGDQEFKCNRVILASRSTVFKAMMLNEHFVENRQNSVTIENASPDNVEAMLEFISKGVVPRDIEEKATDLADRYDLQDLIDICENSLANNLTAENVIETLIAIDLHVTNSQHRQKILDFIKAKAFQVVKSSHWKEFYVKYPDLITEIFLWAAHSPSEATDN